MKNMLVLGGILSFLLLSSCKKDASSPASSGSDNAALVSLAENYGFKPAIGTPDSLHSVTLPEFEQQLNAQQGIYTLSGQNRKTTASTEGALAIYDGVGLTSNIDPTGSVFSNPITWSFLFSGAAAAGFPSLFTVTFMPPPSGLPTGAVEASTLSPTSSTPSITWAYQHLSGSLPGSSGFYLSVLGRETETESLGGSPFTATWSISVGCNQTAASMSITEQ